MSEYDCDFCHGRGCEVCYGIFEYPPPPQSEQEEDEDDDEANQQQQQQQQPPEKPPFCEYCQGRGNCTECLQKQLDVSDPLTLLIYPRGSRGPYDNDNNNDIDNNDQDTNTNTNTNNFSNTNTHTIPPNDNSSTNSPINDCEWCGGDGCDECIDALKRTQEDVVQDNDYLIKMDDDQNDIISRNDMNTGHFPHDNDIKPTQQSTRHLNTTLNGDFVIKFRPKFLDNPNSVSINEDQVINYLFYIITSLATNLYIPLDEAEILFRQYDYDDKRLLDDWYGQGEEYVRKNTNTPNLIKSAQFAFNSLDSNVNVNININVVSPEELQIYVHNTMTQSKHSLLSVLNPPHSNTCPSTLKLSPLQTDLSKVKYLSFHQNHIQEESIFFTNYSTLYPYPSAFSFNPIPATLPNNSTTIQFNNIPNEDKEYTCLVCTCDYTFNQLSTFPCGHHICHDCLQGYVESEFAQDGIGVLHMTCPGIGLKDDSGVYSNENTLKCSYLLPFSFVFRQLALLDQTSPLPNHTITNQNTMYNNANHPHNKMTIPSSHNDTHLLFSAPQHHHITNAPPNPTRCGRYHYWIVVDLIDRSKRGFVNCPSSRGCGLIITNPCKIPHAIKSIQLLLTNLSSQLHSSQYYTNQLVLFDESDKIDFEINHNQELEYSSLNSSGNHNDEKDFFETKKDFMFKISQKIFCCPCGTLSCTLCGYLGSHFPIPCSISSDFLSQISGESLSERLIQSTTKQCPKCEIWITKDKNCNHVICAKCTFEFCFLCKSQWDSHISDPYKCKEYQQSSSNNNKGNGMENERLQLEYATQQSQKVLFYNAFFQSFTKLQHLILKTHHTLLQSFENAKNSDDNKTTVDIWGDDQELNPIQTYYGLMKTSLRELYLHFITARWTILLLHYTRSSPSTLLLRQIQADFITTLGFFNGIVMRLVNDGLRSLRQRGEGVLLTTVRSKSFHFTNSLFTLLYPINQSLVNDNNGVEAIYDRYKMIQNKIVKQWDVYRTTQAQNLTSSQASSHHHTTLTTPQQLTAEDQLLMPKRAMGTMIRSPDGNNNDHDHLNVDHNHDEDNKNGLSLTDWSTTTTPSSASSSISLKPSNDTESVFQFIDTLSLTAVNGDVKIDINDLSAHDISNNHHDDENNHTSSYDNNWCCPTCYCLHFNTTNNDIIFDDNAISSLVGMASIQGPRKIKMSQNDRNNPNDDNTNRVVVKFGGKEMGYKLPRFYSDLLNTLGLIDISETVDKTKVSRWKSFVKEREVMRIQFQKEIEKENMKKIKKTLTNLISATLSSLPQQSAIDVVNNPAILRRRQERSLYWKSCREDFNYVVINSGKQQNNIIKDDKENNNILGKALITSQNDDQIVYIACYQGLYYNFNGNVVCANCKSCYTHNEVDCRLCFSF